MMAESLDDGEFWLPPQFLADDDTMSLDHQKNTDFSSPGESVKALSETESDEEDFITNLTLHMARSTITDGFGPENAKGRVVSGSPQSILCDMGSGNGCSQGSSRGSPKSQCKVSSPTWDLLHAAAGEVAKIRMDESYGVMKNSNSASGFYQPRHHHNHMQAMQFQNLQYQEMLQRQNMAFGENSIHRKFQGGVGNGENRDSLPSNGLFSSSAWLPPQHQTHNSGMRALFLGNQGGGGKRECAGTGVFLPRHIGNTQSEPRKKQGCSTVLVPAKVIQALNLNMDKICSQPHLQPIPAGKFNSKNDVLLRLQSNRGFGHQRHNGHRQPVMDHEIKLPQEWTY